jgi:hypothetical protein
MRRILALFCTITLTIVVTTSVNAFCLFSCMPSDSNARTVFENLLKRQFANSPFNIVSFEKTNGVEREVFGQKIYELSFKALIELPNGANDDCKPNPNFNWGNFHAQNMCGVNNRKYWPPGQKLSYSENYVFQKTERGWQGPDGVLY